MKQNAIIWPSKYTPGFTDNFCSNEIIVRGVDLERVVDGLCDAANWTKYYQNCADVKMHNQDDTRLKMGTRFEFKTFGFLVQGEVMECSRDGDVLRLAWKGWNDATGDEYLEVYHAWLVERLDGDRVRILTQESQLGTPAVALANSRPNTMINGHQDWLIGLVGFAKGDIA